MSNPKHQICTRCIMDTSDPDIRFDAQGICNKCTAVYNSLSNYPYNLSKTEKKIRLEKLIQEIKKDGQGKPYDCIIGVSGGVDSTYIAYKLKQLGINPLAVHLDNGWDSELAQKNIENFLTKLKIDLYTYVIDWEEFKDLQLAFLKSSTPDSEIPSDHAIVSVMYQMAAKYRLHYIVTGVNFATESISVPAWSNGIWDWKYVKSIHKQFGTKKLVTFPRFTLVHLFYYRFLSRIKRISLLDYLQYDKFEAIKILTKKFNFKYYGDKHYESIYTKFFQAYILPKKFGYDKRKIHLSSLICSGIISRNQALEEMKKPLYTKKKLAQDLDYVLKKLDLSQKEFTSILQLPKKRFWDFPSYQNSWYYKYIWSINLFHRKKIQHKYYQ